MVPVNVCDCATTDIEIRNEMLSNINLQCIGWHCFVVGGSLTFIILSLFCINL